MSSNRDLFGRAFEELTNSFRNDFDQLLEEYPQVRRAADYARERAKEAWAPKAEQVDASISRFIAYTNAAEWALKKCVEHAPTPEAANEASQALNHLHTSRHPKND